MNINSPEKYKVNNPIDIEKPDLIKQWYEPICTASIITPIDYSKSIKTLILEKRGIIEKEEYLNDGKVLTL
jgi:translation elongation factor EF-4